MITDQIYQDPTRNENPSNRPYLRIARTVTKLYSIYVIVHILGPWTLLNNEMRTISSLKIDE